MKNITALIFVGLAVLAFKEKMSTSDAPLFLKENSAKSEYMSSYAPHLKNTREQVSYEIVTCSKNIESLTKLLRNFDTEKSREAVYKKIEEIKIQRGILKGTLYKIDAEVERGMLIKQCNIIEEGGLRFNSLDDLLRETQERLFTAKQINNSNSQILHSHPPKVIRVR